MNGTRESIILCEGYHDRAFWKGWLLHRFGCVEARAAKATWRFRGVYTYQTPAGALLHVVPCESDRDVLQQAADTLGEVARKPLSRLVVNLDVDLRQPEDRCKAIEGSIRGSGHPMTQITEGDWKLGDTLVSALLWHVPDPVPAGAPEPQTLERLACAALCAVYPERGEAVRTWLQSRPEPSRAKEHKAIAWTHMAGWYAGQGCDAFYTCLWTDPPVAAELERLLRATSAWQVAEALVT